MDELVLKIFTAGFGDEAEGWMNILIFIVVVVFYAVVGIIKASSQKSQEKQKQQSSRKPVRKIPRTTPTRDSSFKRSQKTLQARPQTRLPRTSHAPGPDKVLRSQVVESPEKLESTSMKSLEEVTHQDLPEFAGKPLLELDSMRLDHPERVAEAEEEGLSELDLNYADPDELVKAILHYEILGPPVSLRDPPHRNSVF
ncbi:MAG: hypothetical protein JXM79_18615 [Sedimentisphaerales bacterium]|nr:hypothetical protein [Sedimentisphaerales bacterium]